MSVGVLNPANIKELSHSIGDIDSHMFWKFLEEGFFKGQEAHLHLLEGTIMVKARTSSPHPCMISPQLQNYMCREP